MIDTLTIKIGHAAYAEAHTGCTVFLLPDGCVVSSDIRGAAPGSREAALMRPEKRIEYAHAILLTGGSAFGLAAADGVMRWLSDNDIGHWTPIRPIPLVPASVIYDLLLSGGDVLPDAALGYQACENALLHNPAQGNVGVGAGASIGKWNGLSGNMKGGFGLAFEQVGELKVFAAVVCNPVGDVLAEDGSMLAGARLENGEWAVSQNKFRLSGMKPSITNTTLAVVGTNAKLTKIEAHRVAGRMHDGMAQAIRPIHTSHDGDSAYAVATGEIEASYDWVANLSAELVARAIRNGAKAAKTAGGALGLAD